MVRQILVVWQSSAEISKFGRVWIATEQSELVRWLVGRGKSYLIQMTLPIQRSESLLHNAYFGTLRLPKSSLTRHGNSYFFSLVQDEIDCIKLELEDKYQITSNDLRQFYTWRFDVYQQEHLDNPNMFVGTIIWKRRW